MGLETNTVIENNSEKAKFFNNFFVKVSNIDFSDASTLDFNEIDQHDKAVLEFINITKQDVVDKVECLNNKEAYGCDEISSVFINSGGEVHNGE